MNTPPLILCVTIIAGAALADAKADPQPVTVSFNPSLRQELVAMAAEDQRVRKDVGASMSAEQFDEMQRVDLQHTERLSAIVAEHGWPGRSLVGEDAASKAWLLVQHCELEFQERCLPVIERAMTAGEIQGRDYAGLVDRVRMRRGEPQVYGTQLRTCDGETSVYPIENPAEVDDRRRAIGLPSLAEQMKRIGVGANRGPEFNEALRVELAAMAAQDQRIIKPTASAEEIAEQKRTHALNVKRLKEIIDQHGWPGRSLVGAGGAFNAWLLVQNSGDSFFMQKCLLLLERAVAAGEASARSYAYLYDSLRLAQGQPQVYGTQFTNDAAGRLALHPIEDRSQVDERRRSVGLEPLEAYERRIHAGRN
ncbi:MAG TPA: DUF6624 domain-containing protein [Opitutaceae bacterium]